MTGSESVVCPECQGAKWDPVCSFCDGSGFIEFELLRSDGCRECGGPVEKRDGSDGRVPVRYCDNCGLLDYD